MMGMFLAARKWLAALEISAKLALFLFLFGVLLIAAFTTVHLIQSMKDLAKESGAATVRGEVATKGLQNVEKANRAEVIIDHDSDAAFAQCVRYSRTPENC